MTKSRSQLMVERLRDLQASSPDIEASAVVSVDGLSIASALPQGIEDDRVSAMSAAMLSLGERIATELGRGTLEQVYIKGEKGYVVLMSVGEEAVLTALAHEQAQSCVQVVSIRGGRNLGQRSHFPSQTQGFTAEEIVEAFLGQYYRERQPPAQIIVSHDPPDLDLLKSVLSEKAGRKVAIQAHPRGERRQMLKRPPEWSRS